jgi:hypothetical protein
MEIKIAELPENYRLYDTGDWHLGPLTCHFDGVCDLIEKIAQDKAGFVVLKGDLGDAVTPGDKRYAHASMDFKRLLLTPMEQAEKLVEILRPIKDKILTSVIGNHEYTHINTVDMTKYICNSLGVHYGAAACKVHAVVNGKLAHKYYITHGRGCLPSGAKDPIQREANVKAALKRKLENTGHADCIYMSCGHFHRLIEVAPTINKEIVLVDDGKELQQVHRYHGNQAADYIPPEARWYGCSGSFLRLYPPPGSGAISYGEMAMYGPTELGWLEAAIEDGRMVRLEKHVAGIEYQNN